jgi:hypothetical protein
MTCDNQRVPRAATGKTPVRNARIPDEVWLPAIARAEIESRSASDAMTDALRRYGLDDSPASYDLTFANWPDAATWLEPAERYDAFAEMDTELSNALAWPKTNAEYLTVATWHASTRHPGDPKQQARVIAGHVLRKVLPEFSWADRYRDARHLTETVIAILSRHLPLAATPKGR